MSTAAGDFEHVDICFAMNKFDWWKGRDILPMHHWATDGARDYYTIDLKGDDTRLAYIFILYENGRTWYFSEEGLCETYDFKRAYYTHFQNPFIHDCDVHHVISWADTAVMYQIFPERFQNGSGNKPYINAKWSDVPTPKSFFGGDLKGIEQQLDYLKSLHVNCLYLNPIFPSISNHKYDIIDYFGVDEGFGGKAAFASLMIAAKKNGFRVILDGVFNHCSALHPFFQDVVKNGRASPYWNWFFIEGDRVDMKRVNYLTFASVAQMPKLNTGNPEVIRYFCSVGAWWIRQYGIDGWRLDVMDETSTAFLRAFRTAVKAADKDALILGESWHASESYLLGDQLDGVMNYGFTKACMDYLAEGTIDASGFAARLIRLLNSCAAPASVMMMNLLGSHDTDRFLTLLNGDMKKMKLAFCLLFFFVGIPCVYYGDEIGMTGGYDPLCRGGFPWDESKWDEELRSLVSRLSGYRISGLLGGNEISIEANKNILVLKRPRLTLCVNASERPGMLDGITVPPMSCQIIEN